MPCPLFIPVSPLGELNPGATPLGDLFGGMCAAEKHYEIPTEILRCCCNFGYARERCALAAQSEADSSCFVISKIENTTVQVRWSLERDHHPLAVGELEVTAKMKAGTPIEAQAHAYASVYRRRRGSL